MVDVECLREALLSGRARVLDLDRKRRSGVNKVYFFNKEKVNSIVKRGDSKRLSNRQIRERSLERMECFLDDPLLRWLSD